MPDTVTKLSISKASAVDVPVETAARVRQPDDASNSQAGSSDAPAEQQPIGSKTPNPV